MAMAQTNGAKVRVMAEGTANLEQIATEAGADGSADTDIVEAIRQGDHENALRLCARRHGAPVGRLCMALLGSAEDADDIVQETLLDAHAGFTSFRGESSLRAWLFAIARRKCARHLEKTARRRNKLRLVHDAQRGEGEELMILRERARVARALLDQIRPSEREALVLRFVAELSYREVGEACGIDEVAARKRVSRAISKMKQAVADKEQEP